MPELPEVETIRRQLEPSIAGAEVVDGDAHWSAKFSSAIEIVGTEILSIGRRGKYLIFELDDGRELIAHLGMTGAFSVIDANEVPGARCVDHDDYTRALWQFGDGRQLAFRDVRRFGRIHVVEAGQYGAIATLHQMGPEPLTDDFDGKSLHAATRKSTRAIKTQLLSQKPVAGVGNIYADEALFIARINPKARRVGRARCDALADAIKSVLATGIANGGTTLRDYVDADGESGRNQHELLAYGRAGEPCTVCAAEMSSFVLDARTTTYCRNCQRQ